ncbi:hypothetical protein JOM56_010825 [Amanita muscaria]
MTHLNFILLRLSTLAASKSTYSSPPLYALTWLGRDTFLQLRSSGPALSVQVSDDSRLAVLCIGFERGMPNPYPLVEGYRGVRVRVEIFYPPQTPTLEEGLRGNAISSKTPVSSGIAVTLYQVSQLLNQSYDPVTLAFNP